MEVIKPSEISGKIMSLIEEAEKFVFVVSPYYDISNWRKLLKKIEIAKKKGVEFTFCVRKPERESEYKNLNEIQKMGFNAIQIERLHAKFYFNESEAIVTSMNLTEASDIASIDIGLKTENKKELDDIQNFYRRYINSKKEVPFYGLNNFLDELQVESSKIFNFIPEINFEGEEIEVNGNNRYQISIVSEKGNVKTLKLNCVLSAKEFSYLDFNYKKIKSSRCKIELQRGNEKHYHLIWAILPNLKSNSIRNIRVDEYSIIKEVVIDFFDKVEKIKKQIRYSKI